jgi:6-phosphogluconolactonase
VLEPLEGPFAEVKMGPYSGPRGLNFHPSLRVAYVNCELSGTVVVCAINDKTGLQPLQSLSA